jgi:hypothetical protein
MKAEDYEVVKVIGRGAFGEVQLVGYLTQIFLNTTSFNILFGKIIVFIELFL